MDLDIGLPAAPLRDMVRACFRDGATQPDAVNVADRDEHGRFIRDDPEMIKTACRPENGLVFDPFDDT